MGLLTIGLDRALIIVVAATLDAPCNALARVLDLFVTVMLTGSDEYQYALS